MKKDLQSEMISFRNISMGEDGQVHFFRQEAHGDSLAFLLEGGPLSESGALGIMKQLCRIVQSLNDQGFVHRGICPENVRISGDQVILAGCEDAVPVSRESVEKNQEYQRTQTSGFPELTGTHAFQAGPMGYAPPEQFSGHGAAVTEDIFALGVLWNRLLTGKHPAEQLAGGHPGRIISKATRMNPARRYQTVTEFEAAMEKKRPFWILPVGAALAVLTVFCFVLAGRHKAAVFEGKGTLLYENGGELISLRVATESSSDRADGELEPDDSSSGQLVFEIDPGGAESCNLILLAEREDGSGAAEDFSEKVKSIHASVLPCEGTFPIRIHSPSDYTPAGSALYLVYLGLDSRCSTNDILFEIEMKNGDVLGISTEVTVISRVSDQILGQPE